MTAVSSDIKAYAPASHEVLLLFDLNFQNVFLVHLDTFNQLS